MEVRVRHTEIIERIAVEYPLNRAGLKQAEEMLTEQGYRITRKGPGINNDKVGLMIGERKVNPPTVAMIGEEQRIEDPENWEGE